MNEEFLVKSMVSSFTGAVAQYASTQGVTDWTSLSAVVRRDCQSLIEDQKLPPIFLYAPSIQEQQRIESIRKLKMAIDGRVYPHISGLFCIEVNSKSHVGRQNFTLGHEIGHTLFLPFESRERNRRSDHMVGLPHQDNTEERLCDIAAAELLMPEQMYQRFAFDWGPSVFSILQLRRTFQCSEMATVRRFVEVSGWRTLIGSWSFQQDTKEFRAEWSHATPNLGVLLPRGQIVKEDPILQEAWRTNNAQQGNIDLGFHSTGFSRLDEQFFTQAFAYGAGEQRRLMTVSVLERNPEALVDRFSAHQASKNFDKKYKTRQLELLF